MNSWSDAMLSPEQHWEPEKILQKLENYMTFLSLLQNYLFGDGQHSFFVLNLLTILHSQVNLCYNCVHPQRISKRFCGVVKTMTLLFAIEFGNIHDVVIIWSRSLFLLMILKRKGWEYFLVIIPYDDEMIVACVSVQLVQ